MKIRKKNKVKFKKKERWRKWKKSLDEMKMFIFFQNLAD